MYSYPTRNRKFQKNSKKIQNSIIPSFQAKIGWKMPRKGENKKNRVNVCLPDP